MKIYLQIFLFYPVQTYKTDFSEIWKKDTKVGKVQVGNKKIGNKKIG